MRFILQTLSSRCVPGTLPSTKAKMLNETLCLPAWNFLCSPVCGNPIFLTMDMSLSPSSAAPWLGNLGVSSSISLRLFSSLEMHTYLLVPLGGLSEVKHVHS